jgi:acyl dehydratase
MYLFDTFKPGEEIGRREMALDQAQIDRWVALFPEDRDGARMPPGMMAAVQMRAYSDLLQPRPPGNVHGAQQFRLVRLPSAGDTLVTTLTCQGKELKGERRWVRFVSDTRGRDGELLFTGVMTTLWAK